MEFFSQNISIPESILCLHSLIRLLKYTFEISSIMWSIPRVIMTGRPLFQCLISVERYLAAVHAVTFLKYKPLRYKVACSSDLLCYCLGGIF